MAYENLCMYCFKDMNGEEICPHCGKDSRAAVPQIQLLPGTQVYHDRFLIGRALGQDANGIVYAAMDTKRGATIRIREYMPRNCAERLNDGGVVPVAGMEDPFDAGMKKLRAGVESVEDAQKRHFYFEENGTAYIVQRKSAASASAARDEDDDEDAPRGRGRSVALYIAIAAAVVVAVVIGLLVLFNSLGSDDAAKVSLPSASPTAASTWQPLATASPTPYATATFAALVDPELSWMDYTYSGDVNSDYSAQTSATAKATAKPTILDSDTNYSTVTTSSNKQTVTQLQQYLVNLGWLSQKNVTGKYDSATKQAVKDFQTYVNNYCSPAEKLTVDGIAGKKTQQWLYNSSIQLKKPSATATPAVTASAEDIAVNANSSKADVRALQNKLIALGIMKEGSADGIYGTSTKNAVKNFQSRVNQLQGYDALEVSGIVDSRTMAYLNYYIDWWESQQTATATPAPTQTADDGTVNASSAKTDIAEVQSMLVQVGLLSGSDVDGVYGKGTVAAVKNFQNWVNEKKNEQTLTVSGECDALTRAYLEYCVSHNMKASVAELPTQTPTAAPTATTAPTQVPTEAPTQAPTQAPTPEPTAVPTEVPTPEPTEAPTEIPEGSNIRVDGSSDSDTVAYVQQMLCDIGLMADIDIDGDYGRKTTTAVGRFQELVNDRMGKHTLDVTGLCDDLTLQYMEYYQGNGWTVYDATEAPTEQPTEAPSNTVDAASDAQTIVSLQEKLRDVNMISASDVDGIYGAVTADAIAAFQQFVNDLKGETVLEITGTCDELTMQYLDYCVQKGKDVGSAIEAMKPAEQKEEEEAQPTDEPEITPEPTPEPTAVPVGTIEGMDMNISGGDVEDGIVRLTGSDYSVSWLADGDVEGYYLELLDENGDLVSESGLTQYTEFSMDTSKLNPGAVYTLRIGAMPTNGTEQDIVWREMRLMAVSVTPEPTEEPTPTPEPTPEPTAVPTVSKPTITIGSSAYQQDGVPYLTTDPIFTWMAEGDVEGYHVMLEYQDGTQYELGTVTSTSKTVPLDQLAPGLYKLHVTAIAGNGSVTAESEMLFGVPEDEPQEIEEPQEIDEPEIEAPTEEPAAERITYLDANSAYEDIYAVQVKLYQAGMVSNVDNMQQGVLDQETLLAIAAFQQRANELYGLNLTVIDPEPDAAVDAATLDALLYQNLDFSME